MCFSRADGAQCCPRIVTLEILQRAGILFGRAKHYLRSHSCKLLKALLRDISKRTGIWYNSSVGDQPQRRLSQSLQLAISFSIEEDHAEVGFEQVLDPASLPDPLVRFRWFWPWLTS